MKGTAAGRDKKGLIMFRIQRALPDSREGACETVWFNGAHPGVQIQYKLTDGPLNRAEFAQTSDDHTPVPDYSL
ncbi:hypothetical protein NDU88_007517 [Pleurodeles waltl]|uniref:Uncharacterized protein n=1 Tax=Pleurodeles waltl TaxID=8319 RepID=A0AAV7ST24_PLEWA|nr:hypothetical protein NDU88_007517 [Pleurodeles waltl]